MRDFTEKRLYQLVELLKKNNIKTQKSELPRIAWRIAQAGELHLSPNTIRRNIEWLMKEINSNGYTDVF